MLGRFLEISIHTPNIQESLHFYEQLGFAQAVVGDTWAHHYAVVTDGRLFIGLHARRCPPIALTFVQPDLEKRAPLLLQAGIVFDNEQFTSDAFHEAGFADPLGMHVNLLEARTFSPPALDTSQESTLGYFSELGIPVREYDIAREFWERLGFVGMEPDDAPFSRLALVSKQLNIGLYKSRALRQPVLTFEDPDMSERIARLREKNFSLTDEMPDSLDESRNAVLIAPEGTRLLLLSSD